MKIREAEYVFRNQLSDIYSERESEILFLLVSEKILKRPKQDLLLKNDFEITSGEEKEILRCLDELARHKPVQYVLNEAHFFGNTFFVNENVLIPRPETEELVEWVLDTVNSDFSPSKKLNILDIGTGSGCIAVSLRKKIQEASVTAMDVSEKALEICKKNAVANQAEIHLICDDILNPKNILYKTKYDIIVSNPPYISESEMRLMEKNVTDYEPHLALFTEDSDPLKFYKKIADFAHAHLAKNGFLFFEIHKNYGKEICSLLEREHFSEIILKKDLQGNNRMVKCRMK